MNNEATRLKEIISVISKHDLLKNKSPQNIRETIEELGPTFVKMGQILSSRSDLIPSSISDELKKLRCSVKPMTKEEVYNILNREYQGNVDEYFEKIEENPIGSASIAQTHLGILKTKEKVAIKIQRPNIYEMMTLDTKLLKKAISILKLDKIFSNIIDLQAILDEMYDSAKEEMDFLIEANHIEQFKNNNQDIAYIKPLIVHKEISTPYVLVMEFIDGPFINETEKLISLGYDMEEIANKLADNYIKQAIDDGFYHADPHSDNIKIQNGKIVYLDFGMMGTLTQKNKRILNDCIDAIISNNISDIAHILVSLDVSSNDIDYMKLKSDIKRVLDKNKTTEISSINIKEFASDMFELLNSNSITLPKDISMLIRGIVVIEGVLEEINPNINLMQVLKNRVKTKNFITKEYIEKNALKLLQNSNSLCSIPNEALTLLKGVNNGELRFQIELNDSKNQMNRIEDIFHQAIITILDLAFIIGISVMAVMNKSNLPFIFYVYIIFAIIFTIWLFLKMFCSKIKRKK